MSAEQTPAACNQSKPKCLCRRYAPGCVILLLLAVLPAWWFCFRSIPLRISKETTYVTEPLTSDGKRIDYFKALEQKIYPPQMQTEDNGYRLIVKHCGLSEETFKEQDDLRKQYYEKLALDPNDKPTLELESPVAVFERFNKGKTKEEQKTYDPKPWTFEEFPMLEDWLNENTAGIDLLGEAVRKPAFCVPYVRENEDTTMFAFVLPGVNSLRDYAQAAEYRANYRIAAGDIDGAVYDTMTIYRLARFTSKHGTLVHNLVGLSIDIIAHRIAINGNPDHPLTKAQIERIIHEYDSLPPKYTAREVLDTERLFTLGALGDFLRQPFYGTGDKESDAFLEREMFPLSWLPSFYDANAIYIFFNRIYDSLDSPDAWVTLEDDARAVSRNPLRYLTIKGRTEQVSYGLAALLLPAVGAHDGAVKRNECCGNLKRLTLALLLYEQEHGKLPAENWREAVKPYLSKEAEQCMHCPLTKKNKTDYALVVGEERTGETPLLVEVDVTIISESGTIPNDPALLVCPQDPHRGVYGISYRNGSVAFKQIEKQ